MSSGRAWLLGLLLLSAVLTGCYRAPIGMSAGVGYYDAYGYGYPYEYPFYDYSYPPYYYPYYYPAIYFDFDYLYYRPYFYRRYRPYPYYYGHRRRAIFGGSPFYVTPRHPGGGGIGEGGGVRHR